MPKDSDNVRVQAEPSSLDLLNTVSVKVPAFWPDSVETWFVQVEAQFALKGVTASLTKFYYCVSSFNQETANQVLDLIKSPPSSEPYEALKNRLLKLFALDDYQRYKAISNLPLSGDMKPSKLMSSMLALLPVDHKPCFFLHGSFLKRLPTDVRAHLLRDDFSDPISLALKADKIYKSRVSSSPVYAVSSTPEDSVNAVRSPAANRSCRSATPHAADARITGPCLLLCVITIVLIVPKPRNAELLVPGRETDSPAGGCSYPTCRTFNLVSFNLITGFSEFKEVSHQLWCLCIRFSCSKIFVQLFRSKTTDCRWFISLMLGFSFYSSTIREPQVGVAFSVSSCSHPNLGCGFSETL